MRAFNLFNVRPACMHIMLIPILCAWSFAWPQKNGENVNTDIAKVENLDIGKDVIVFDDYSQLVNPAPLKSLDVRADMLIDFIDARLRCGDRIEQREVWEAIAALTPYRMTHKVHSAVEAWAAFYAKAITQSPLPGTQRGTRNFFAYWIDRIKDWFENIFHPDMANAQKMAARAYKAQKFAEATKRYIAILKQDAQNIEIRNNLALLCMHQGNDPAALVQLSIVKELKPDYFPGLINLTIVLERVGLESQASAMAQEALRLHPDVPAAVINAAWFEVLAGNMAAAKKILTPIAKLDTSNKNIRQLYELTRSRR